MNTKGLLIAIALLAGCEKTNPNYCMGSPDNNCNETIDAAPDGPASCATTACAAGVCDTATKMCVQCTSSEMAACTGTTPTCGADDTCHACTLHSQCLLSNVCLPSGACGDAADIAYVSNPGSGTACTHDAPCATITTALATTKTVIKISGTINDQVNITSGTVTLVADPGAKLTSTTTGTLLTLSGTANVTIYDLEIAAAIGTTSGVGDGILLLSTGSPAVGLYRATIDGCQNVGISAAGGRVAMSRSVVSGNTNGGAYLTTDFDITNSLFVANGGGLSTTGGLTVGPVSSNYVFQFNTVADNLSSTATAASRGVNCITPIAMSNIIATGNESAANCAATYSLFDINTTVTSTNMTTADARFRNTNAAAPGAPDFYRIANDSPAVDHGDPAATMLIDIDGNPRPELTNFDIGANEYKP